MRKEQRERERRRGFSILLGMGVGVRAVRCCSRHLLCLHHICILSSWGEGWPHYRDHRTVRNHGEERSRCTQTAADSGQAQASCLQHNSVRHPRQLPCSCLERPCLALFQSSWMIIGLTMARFLTLPFALQSTVEQWSSTGKSERGSERKNKRTNERKKERQLADR